VIREGKSYGPQSTPSSGRSGFIGYNRTVIKNPIFNPAWGLFVLLLIVAAGGVVSHLHQPKNLVPWRSDLVAARNEAMSENKPLFLDFGASWCPDCQALAATTWSNRAVADALGAYIPVSIDVDAHPDLAGQFDVKAIPALFVVDPKTGAILKLRREGVRSPSDLLRWLGESSPG
jgi:thiol-disulfide isomerase/thioredoxin